MGSVSGWLEDLSTLQVLLLVVGVLLGGSLLAAIVGGILVRFGMRRPAVLRFASGLAMRGLELIKRPLTIVVLDEVAAVIQTGHYTRNISDALLENHDELKTLVAEKVRQDPSTRLVNKRGLRADRLGGERDDAAGAHRDAQRPADGRARLRPAAQQPGADQAGGARARARGDRGAGAARPDPGSRAGPGGPPAAVPGLPG